MNNSQIEYKGLGRRKSAVSRVKLVPGTGKFMVNDKTSNEYFPNPFMIQDFMQPLIATNTQHSYDVFVRVNGGGFAGQAGAIRLGVAKALLAVNPDFKATLKIYKLLTRDARVKERKKYGLYGARRRPQFTKR